MYPVSTQFLFASVVLCLDCRFDSAEIWGHVTSTCPRIPAVSNIRQLTGHEWFLIFGCDDAGDSEERRINYS